MKNLSFLLVLVLAAAVVAEGPSYTTTTDWATNGSGTTMFVSHVSGTDALTYYTDLSTFEGANPGLTHEDYSSTLVPANSVASDTGPLDYFCNNSLFALNTIVPGISLAEWSGGLMVVLTPPFLGVTSVTVGPNTFLENAVYDFTLPTRAFGCFVCTPFGAVPVDIEIFGASGSLGTTTVVGDIGAGTFWGVYCDDENIEKIEFYAPNDEGELFADVQFGLPTGLSRSTWAQVKASFE